MPTFYKWSVPNSHVPDFRKTALNYICDYLYLLPRQCLKGVNHEILQTIRVNCIITKCLH
jgi:hypothetical protein